MGSYIYVIMEINVIKTGNGVRRSLQTTLDNVFSGKVTSLDEFMINNMSQKSCKPKIESTKLVIDDNNLIYYKEPKCKRCGTDNVIKWDKNSREKETLGGFILKFKEQGYKCKECGHVFYANEHGLIMKNKHYLTSVVEAVDTIQRVGYQSLRKISKYTQNLLDVKVSHVSIMNWTNKMPGNIIKMNGFNFSGYYTMDGQFIKLWGYRLYRILLYDNVLNIPVMEKIVYDRTYEEAEKFLEEAIADKPFFNLTTDGLALYHKLTDRFGVKHQLCLTHFKRNIFEKLEEYCKSKNLSDEDSKIVKKRVDPIFNAMDLDSKEEARKAIDEYLIIADRIPKPVMDFIEKNLFKHWDKYFYHLEDPFIVRTSNRCEYYFNATLASFKKKLYKTVNGVMSFLLYRAIQWICEHGKVPEESLPRAIMGMPLKKDLYK